MSPRHLISLAIFAAACGTPMDDDLTANDGAMDESSSGGEEDESGDESEGSSSGEEAEEGATIRLLTNDIWIAHCTETTESVGAFALGVCADTEAGGDDGQNCSPPGWAEAARHDCSSGATPDEIDMVVTQPGHYAVEVARTMLDSKRVFGCAHGHGELVVFVSQEQIDRREVVVVDRMTPADVDPVSFDGEACLITCQEWSHFTCY